MIDKLILFLRPWVKRLSVQPTLGDRPIGKPFRYLALKLGYSVYFVSFKPKIKISKLGQFE